MHLPKIEALPRLLTGPERYGQLVLTELFTPVEAAELQAYPELPETLGV